MLMVSFSLIASVIIHGICTIPTASPTTESVRDLATLLDDISHKSEVIETSFYSLLLPFVPENENLQLDPSSQINTVTLHWRSSKNEFALEETRMDAAMHEPMRLRHYWDGKGLYRQVVGEAGGSIGITRREAISDPCWLLFNHDFSDYVIATDRRPMSLSTAIMIGRPIEFVKNSESTTYRFELFDHPKAIMISIRVNMLPEPYLAGLTWEVPTRYPASNPTGIRAKCVYETEAVARFDGVLLPAKARRDLYVFEHQDSESGRRLVGRNYYVRQKAPNLSTPLITPHEPFVAFAAGGYIHDRRSRIAYQIGSKRIIVDGTVYRTRKIVGHHPEHDLADLLQDATALAPSTLSASASTTDVSPEHNLTRSKRREWILASVSTILAFVGLLIGFRGRASSGGTS